MQNLRFCQILTMCTFMQNLWLKVKNTLTSSVILYWKARLIQNPKFKVVERNVDNLYSHANPQVKSKKNQVLYSSEKLRSWWIQNLRFWQILATNTSMQNFRLRVKNTTKSHVIHPWKAKVMQNKKNEIVINFENLYF